MNILPRQVGARGGALWEVLLALRADDMEKIRGEEELGRYSMESSDVDWGAPKCPTATGVRQVNTIYDANFVVWEADVGAETCGECPRSGPRTLSRFYTFTQDEMTSFRNLRRAAVFIGVPVAAYMLVSRIIERETNEPSADNKRNESLTEAPQAEAPTTTPMSQQYASVFKAVFTSVAAYEAGEPEVMAVDSSAETISQCTTDNALTGVVITCCGPDAAKHITKDAVHPKSFVNSANLEDEVEPNTAGDIDILHTPIKQDSPGGLVDDTPATVGERVIVDIPSISTSSPLASENEEPESVRGVDNNDDDDDETFSGIDEDLLEYVQELSKVVPTFEESLHSRMSSSSSILSSTSNLDSMKSFGSPVTDYSNNGDEAMKTLFNPEDGIPSRIKAVRLPSLSTASASDAWGVLADEINPNAAISLEHEQSIDFQFPHVQDKIDDVVEAFVVPGDRDFELLYALGNDGEVCWWRPDVSMVMTMDEAQIGRFHQLYPGAASLREEILCPHLSDSDHTTQEENSFSQSSGSDDASMSWVVVETFIVPGDHDFELQYALADDGDVYWWRPDCSKAMKMSEVQATHFFQLYPEATKLRNDILEQLEAEDCVGSPHDHYDAPKTTSDISDHGEDDCDSDSSSDFISDSEAEGTNNLARCDWMWLGKKEMVKPSLGPELKLTTSESEEYWLEEPDYLTSHTEIDEFGHLTIDPYKGPIELDREAFGNSGQVGTLQKCTWIAFPTKNALCRSLGPVIKVTSPEGKESWLEDLAYYPLANSWADLDEEEE
ncbi:hypothetical protein B0H67DRAFT_551674 [Lasiosphaeris hirsuta]|uniref:Uncharacterized protein n=1 Tax=Lasiosphaeris hirsuta TaxID=260670 RepID=A0AA40ANX2_9PEZI|nr:hypothetical protein B0H67DRAFT_551674 [Lasiosphaeris hirsuta]